MHPNSKSLDNLSATVADPPPAMVGAGPAGPQRKMRGVRHQVIDDCLEPCQHMLRTNYVTNIDVVPTNDVVDNAWEEEITFSAAGRNDDSDDIYGVPRRSNVIPNPTLPAGVVVLAGASPPTSDTSSDTREKMPASPSNNIKIIVNHR